MSRVLLIALFGLVCARSALAANALLVGNEGIDSATCGGESNKCRSISQAIRNAADGDSILVEVGVYGDLNRNGVIGEPGEESGGPNCFCLVLVDKKVTILSERGARATIIDAGTASPDRWIGVRISTSPAPFGYIGMGFTVLIAGEGAQGIRAFNSLPPSVVSGNRVIGLPGASAADRPDYGIAFYGEASGNEVSGFDIGAWGRGSFSGNVFTSNGTGVGTDTGGTIADNIIIDNDVGVAFAAVSSVLFTGNDVARNRVSGITLGVAQSFSGGGSGRVVVQDNNIVGNGYANPATRCGLTNRSGRFVWAADNYWGAQGESDRVCNEPYFLAGQPYPSSTAIDPVRTQPDSRD